MTRTMYDSVPGSIPADATMVAGYVDGKYANVADLQKRFPNATLVKIAVFATTNDGDVLDIETGDATPEQGPSWAQMRRQTGATPTIYCNTSTWPTVKAAFKTANVQEPLYWIADWTGTPHIPTGAIACQYATNSEYDTSLVADHWPGIDPTQTGTDEMPKSFEINGNGGGITFARGTCTNVSFFCDNTLALGGTNLGVDLRIVIWATGDKPDIQTIRVSNRNSAQETVHFKNPSMTHSVTITRADSNKNTVYGEVS